MVNERTVYLINAGIDGELGPEERAELDAVLEASGEARSLQAELRRLTSTMASLPLREPPAGLTERILGRIRLPAPARRPAGHSPRFSLGALFASFQPAQAGLAFAAGLLVTVAFYETALRDGATDDLSSMVGTMVVNPAASAGRAKDSLTISQPDLSGIIALREVGSFVILSFDLESEQATEIEVALAEAGLGFGGIAHDATDGDALDESYEVSGGTLRVLNQGRQAFSVFLPRVTDPSHGQTAKREGSGRQISIGISTGGAVVYSGELRG